MSYMLREIGEQPGWVKTALASQRRAAGTLAEAIRANDVHHVLIAARGTSDHAAIYAKYLFEIVAGIPVSLAAPSVYTLYDARIELGNTLVIGISQSGQGTDVVQVLSTARAAGALTACITNYPESPLAGVSDHVLLCNAGEEKSLAATKTYTTSLSLVALLVAELTNDRELLAALDQAPRDMEQVLTLADSIERSVERYRYLDECAVLGRGLNLPTALEAALKITETSYVMAKPYSGADFLHGPIALVEHGFACILYAPPGRAFPSMLELALKIKNRGGEMVIVSSEEEILELATTPIRIPVNVDERISPLIYILPGQLFAYYLAVARHEDPDRPRGLKKVTRTV